MSNLLWVESQLIYLTQAERIKPQVTIGYILVSHQVFPFRIMRAGGHYHYAIITFNRKLAHYKKHHFANNTITYRAVKQYMTHLQMPSWCSKAECALVSSPHPTQKKAGSHFAHAQKGIMAKIWWMHFSHRRWMRN